MEKRPGWEAGWRDSSKGSVNAHCWPRRKCRTSQRRTLKVTYFGMHLCCSRSLQSLWVSHLITKPPSKKKKKTTGSCFFGASDCLGKLSDELIVGIQKDRPGFPLNWKILLFPLYMTVCWHVWNFDKHVGIWRSILRHYANQLIVWRREINQMFFHLM